MYKLETFNFNDCPVRFANQSITFSIVANDLANCLNLPSTKHLLDLLHDDYMQLVMLVTTNGSREAVTVIKENGVVQLLLKISNTNAKGMEFYKWLNTDPNVCNMLDEL